MKNLKRNGDVIKGQIYWCKLGDEGIGCEQRGNRPVLVIQNNIANKFSTTVIVALLTSKLTKHDIPTHVKLLRKNTGLNMDSIVLLEQIRTISKERLGDYITTLDSSYMKKIETALKLSMDIGEDTEAIEQCNKINNMLSFIDKWVEKGFKIDDILDEVNTTKSMLRKFNKYCDTKKICANEYLDKYCKQFNFDDFKIAV